MGKHMHLLEYCKEMWRQCAESERQRAILAQNIIFLGLLELVLFNYLKKELAVIVVVLTTIYATFSLFLSIKLYERWRFSRNRAHEFYSILTQEQRELSIVYIRDKADLAYSSKLRWFHAQWIRYATHVVVIIEGFSLLAL